MISQIYHIRYDICKKKSDYFPTFFIFTVFQLLGGHQNSINGVF